MNNYGLNLHNYIVTSTSMYLVTQFFYKAAPVMVVMEFF